MDLSNQVNHIVQNSSSSWGNTKPNILAYLWLYTHDCIQQCLKGWGWCWWWNFGHKIESSSIYLEVSHLGLLRTYLAYCRSGKFFKKISFSIFRGSPVWMGSLIYFLANPLQNLFIQVGQILRTGGSGKRAQFGNQLFWNNASCVKTYIWWA